MSERELTIPSRLKLHPTKGVNPHIVVCYRCGGDTGELVLLGIHDSKDKCTGCGKLYIGTRKQAVACCEGSGGESLGHIQQWEKLPGGPCDDCNAEMEEHAEVVKAGGVYWRCEDCGRTGAIRHTSPFAQLVRDELGVKPPDPCIAGFSKNACPACGPDAIVEEGSE